MALDVHRLLGLAALAALLGCSDDGPLLGTDLEAAVSEIVGPAGGVVRLGDRLAIVFPPGALERETLVRVSEIEPPRYLLAAGGVGPAYAVEPQGTVLGAPARVELLVAPSVPRDVPAERLSLVTSQHPLSLGPTAFRHLTVEERRPAPGGVVLVARILYLGPLQAALPPGS